MLHNPKIVLGIVEKCNFRVLDKLTKSLGKEHFDSNGIINISDFGLLAVNFMKMSPVEVP